MDMKEPVCTANASDPVALPGRLVFRSEATCELHYLKAAPCRKRRLRSVPALGSEAIAA
jgi:hypothetical protein